MIFVGIDIGLTGGIARIDPDGLAHAWDMPTRETRVNGKLKRKVDAEALAKLLHFTAHFADVGVFVEAAQASPQMGVSSSFGYGVSFGVVLGVLAHLGVPTICVSAAKWKRDMGLGKRGHRAIGRDEERDKAPAMELARELFPSATNLLTLAKHDGRAEALLLAEYGRRVTNSLPMPSPKEWRPTPDDQMADVEF